MVRKYLNYIIFGFVVLGVFGLAFSHSRHVHALVNDMTGGQPAAQEAAASELVKNEQFSDTVTGEPITTRVKAAESLEILGNHTSLTGEGVVKSSAAVKQLLSMLKDPEKVVRDRAVSALQHVGAKSPENLKELVVGLKDGDTNVQKGTIRALDDPREGIGPVDNPDVIKAIVDLMKAEIVARGPGGDVLSSMKFKDPVHRAKSVHLLTILLDDTDGGVRGGAADALGKIGDPTAIVSLKKHVRDDSDMQVRRVSVGAIALIADRSGEDTLTQAVKDKNTDNEARLQAAAGLGKIATPSAIAVLVTALSDDDLKLRSAAVSALARAYRPTLDGPVNAPALTALIAALQDPSDPIKTGAAQSLQLILTEAAARKDSKALQATNPALLATLRSDDADLRASTASALGAEGNTAAISPLIQALSDPSGDVRDAARDGLAAIGPQATDALVGVLQKGGADAYYASQALVKQGDAALPALQKAAQSPNPVSQRWAAVALGDMPVANGQTSETLKRLAESRDPDVSYVARTQLSRLGQGKAQ